MPQIIATRLLESLHALRRFGEVGNGVVRTALSPPDLESREWLLGQMRDAGLDATIDGVGNVMGRSTRPGPAVLIGSHTDTQPEGGWLDGAMGVMYGIEVARAFNEDPECENLCIDVASWIDEEARFTHFLGSRSFVGTLSPDEEANLIDSDGVGFADALKDAGYHNQPRARFERRRYCAYLEAHIEQGGVLEASAKQIGVVEAIVGIRTFSIVFHGQQNHAGTTPMHLRKDAAMAAFRFAVELDARLREVSEEKSVWTFGDARIHPGAEAIVPGRAELILQMRDIDDSRLDAMQRAYEQCCSDFDRDGITVERGALNSPTPPALMDEALISALEHAAEAVTPGNWLRMPSGAGHDAQIFAPLLPTGMLFVPSIQGVSHSFDEDTAEADIVLGCQVLAHATRAVLSHF